MKKAVPILLALVLACTILVTPVQASAANALGIGSKLSWEQLTCKHPSYRYVYYRTMWYPLPDNSGRWGNCDIGYNICNVCQMFLKEVQTFRPPYKTH